MKSHPLSPPPDAAHLYLHLLKHTLTRLLFPEKYNSAPPAVLVACPEVVRTWLRDHDLALVSNTHFDAKSRAEGRGWPTEAETMIGLERLNNLQHCIESVLLENIPGDILEAGVWRGGASIFARAVLKAYGISNRTVWLADSFQGVPKPDAGRYEKDRGDMLWTAPELAVPLETVQENFRRYGLLDQQVAFLPGWFRDTLPNAPVEQLAVLRLDGDLYESTMIALRALYPKLATGGYVIVDDYGALDCCRAAVDDFRTEFDIFEEIRSIDRTGVYWRIERQISPVEEVLRPARQTPQSQRRASMEHEPALCTLLVIYDSRSDLQTAFPEAANCDFRRLIDWACRVTRGEYHDSAADILKPFLNWFTVNRTQLP